MPEPRISASNTTVCVIDTQTHALAARAMRLTLAAMDFVDALFLSDSGTDTGGARHIAIAPLAGRADYSRFVMKELLPLIATEHVLLIQWDGYVVNPTAWSDDFLRHDYIGARWGFHQDAHCVGNGGFSLRSRRLLEALQDPDIDRFEPEDLMICREYRPLLESRHGIRFAPPDVADRFSFETTYPQGRPLGFHGLFNLWLFLDDAEVPDLIAALPASVVASVQYLSLARNLIDLKRFAAARALLELRRRIRPDDAQCSALLAVLERASAAPAVARPSRNAPCPCGSGQRFKHCCGQAGESTTPSAAPVQCDPEALLRQAMADHQAGRLGAARRGYEAVVAQRPDALAEHYLGVLDMQERRLAEGERRMRAALQLRDDLPDFQNNLGLCLRAQGRLDEAVVEYRKVLDRHPGYAPAWSNLGLDLHKLGQFEEALAAFDRALALDGNLLQARFSRALVQLTLGDYAQGWTGYELRMRCPEYAANYRLPAMPGARLWQGQSLSGRSLLLLGEQGIGDSLQFIRYASQLAARGGRIALQVHQAHVAALLRNAAGVAAVYVGDEALPAHDYYCHLLSLPRLCGTDAPERIPAEIPYLWAPNDRRSWWRGRLDALPARLRVGLAWAGNPANPDDRYRSCPLAALAGLFELPEVAWINLQLGAGRNEMSATKTPILDWGDDQTDFAETAALMAELDLIITVDTSIAHAAGAMGCPVWVLLQHSADFRWLTDRADSPWYPSARLFRQPHAGDWAAVASAVRAALDHFMAERAVV
ncbi:MAG: tetratricopeptide repeat protein [Pseudomonadales bacterium]|nr:tetratricopeptide repeat protein [Pseudomonadales bacterium]